MRIAWISYLDMDVFAGGGELTQRRIVEAGRARGHRIETSAFLRRRPQRALRRTGLYRSIAIDWDADFFVLANLQNSPHLAHRIPPRDIERALQTGRAIVLEDAWVDVCPLDVPCHGDVARCPSSCDRSFGNHVFRSARGAVFVSPLHRDVAAAVLETELPPTVIAHPMVDPDVFRPLGLERDIDVLYVGGISEQKGYYELVECFGEERLTLAGPNLLGHTVGGTYLGELPNEDLPTIYNRARVFAHLPRWIEPQGRTVTEASLCGCELVVNDRVGAMSFAACHRNDPDVVGTHPDRFWDDFEQTFGVS